MQKIEQTIAFTCLLHPLSCPFCFSSIFLKLSEARTRTYRGRRQQTMAADSKRFAEFKAELRIRLVAKRCGCSEGVLILVLIFD